MRRMIPSKELYMDINGVGFFVEDQTARARYNRRKLFDEWNEIAVLLGGFLLKVPVFGHTRRGTRHRHRNKRLKVGPKPRGTEILFIFKMYKKQFLFFWYKDKLFLFFQTPESEQNWKNNWIEFTTVCVVNYIWNNYILQYVYLSRQDYIY